MWKFSGLFRCEKFQAYLGVKISGLKFSGVKFFNPPYLAQFQPNLHVKILAWSHVKISGLKQVWFTCENRCDRFGTGALRFTHSITRHLIWCSYFNQLMKLNSFLKAQVKRFIPYLSLNKVCPGWFHSHWLLVEQQGMGSNQELQNEKFLSAKFLFSRPLDLIRTCG